jgi:hypothetical protein
MFRYYEKHVAQIAVVLNTVFVHCYLYDYLDCYFRFLINLTSFIVLHVNATTCALFCRRRYVCVSNATSFRQFPRPNFHTRATCSPTTFLVLIVITMSAEEVSNYTILSFLL